MLDLVPRAHRADQRDARSASADRWACPTSACSRSSAGCSRRSPGRWACRGGCADDRQPARHAHGRSTSSSPISQLGPLKDDARSEVVHDRDVRAVRLRQLQLDRHADRRHRRAGARARGPTWRGSAAGDARRHAGQLRDGDASRGCCSDRLTEYLLRSRLRKPPAPCDPRIGAVPDVAVVLGSGLGDFAEQPGRRAWPMPYGDAAALAGIARSSATPGKLVVGTRPRATVLALAGRVHFYEGHDLADRDVRRRACWDCSASRR